MFVLHRVEQVLREFGLSGAEPERGRLDHRCPEAVARANGAVAAVRGQGEVDVGVEFDGAAMTRAFIGLLHLFLFPFSTIRQDGHGIIRREGFQSVRVSGGMDFIPGGELSRRIREGDVSAESELIRQFEPGLRVLLRRRTGGDHGLLQDLVQETLLVVIQRLRGVGIDDPQKLAAFAAQTARNLAIASLRKAERQKTDVDSEATERKPDSSRSVEAQTGDLEAALAVRALLRELPQARDRLMLKRFYLEDHDKEHICQEMQLTEAAFNQALSRARRRFRQILEERGFAKRDLLNLGL